MCVCACVRACVCVCVRACAKRLHSVLRTNWMFVLSLVGAVKGLSAKEMVD